MRLAHHPEARTVLLLEDDPDLSQATEMLLHTVGFSMRCASTAADARVAFEQAQPDVLITDIGLVGEDGLSFLRWAKSRARQAKRPLFAIVISGQPDVGTGRSAFAAGADRFHRKPFDPADLVAEVVSATRGTPIGRHLTQAFVDGVRITDAVRHLEHR